MSFRNEPKIIVRTRGVFFFQTKQVFGDRIRNDNSNLKQNIRPSAHSNNDDNTTTTTNNADRYFYTPTIKPNGENFGKANSLTSRLIPDQLKTLFPNFL